MNKISKIIAILPVFLAISCNVLNTTTKSDVESYHDILVECINEKDFHSRLYIFPESIEGAEIEKFCFSHTENPFTGDFLMYLAVKWDEETFNNELARLATVKSVFRNGKEKSIIKFEEQTMYLTVNRNNRYEYALYNQENFEIVYVSNQLYEWKDIPVVEQEHILPSVIIPAELDDGENSYNMYYYYEGDVGLEVTD